MIFDSTIHLGDVITTIGVGVAGMLLHALLKPVRAFVTKVQTNDRRIEDTAEVVDQHSDILKIAGWTKTPMRVVSQKRRLHEDEEYR